MFYELQCGISFFIEDQFAVHYLIDYFVKLHREMAAYLHAQTKQQKVKAKISSKFCTECQTADPVQTKL